MIDDRNLPLATKNNSELFRNDLQASIEENIYRFLMCYVRYNMVDYQKNWK